MFSGLRLLLVGTIILVATMLLPLQDARAQTPAEPQLPRSPLSWFNLSALPFIPIPEIDVDPNSGTTLGIIPTWLITDDHAQIRKIIAPDVLYNPNFGVGARARVFSYPSDDAQWSLIGGLKQRVESEFALLYDTGRLRDRRFSFSGSVIYDRNGTTRFYGVGNGTRKSTETNYTFQQMYLSGFLGWNISHEWQLSYALRARSASVQRGTLASVPSIESRFAGVFGIGTVHESISRVALAYDTRDDATVPTQGGKYVLYGGMAAAHGIIGGSLYSVAGLDLRRYWRVASRAVVAAHLALRYMPGHTTVPFWSLSNLGGDDSTIGESAPLRGFGSGRFYDRNEFSLSLEYRRRIVSLDAMATHIDVELTPFLDLGEVFAHSRELPLSKLHRVFGVGFRGIASPFIVGFVDIGYGSEGVAAFTGIDYPF